MNFEFLKQFNISNTRFIKWAIILAVVFTLLFVLAGLQNHRMGGMYPLDEGMMYDSSVSGKMMGMPEYSESDMYDARLSLQNVTAPSMPPVYGGASSGNTGEAFEVKNYSASIETRDVKRDCGAIGALKARTDVIFENANMYDHGCTYTFKVEKAGVESVVAAIALLDPKELSESTYTIKREVDDYTSEIQIYQNKLATLDATLAEALASYQNITELATREGDVESLAKIIESKLLLIERLTNARIDTQNQLDYIQRSKGEALDRIAYTYFTVNVYEGAYVDTESIKDSWKMAVRQFVLTVNQFAQEMSIGLVALLLLILKYALYGIVLLIALKFGWKVAESMWKSQ